MCNKTKYRLKIGTLIGWELALTGWDLAPLIYRLRIDRGHANSQPVGNCVGAGLRNGTLKVPIFRNGLENLYFLKNIYNKFSDGFWKTDTLKKVTVFQKPSP
jgi:hypothetical protein